MPALSTVTGRIAQDPDFSEHYAREMQAELFADAMIDIADEAHANALAIQRAKLRIDTIKWIALRMLSRYNAKPAHKPTRQVQVIINSAA